MVRSVYLLDTNIISEAIKPNACENVIAKLKECSFLCGVPSVVWHELLFGMNRLEEGKKKKIISEYLINCVQCSFPFFSYDEQSAWIHADIRASLERRGAALPLIDSQIASVAISNNMLLVTRNVKEFEAIKSASSLMIENWFEM